MAAAQGEAAQRLPFAAGLTTFLIALPLLGSAAINLCFGLGASLTFFVTWWAVNTLLQGAGVPPCVRSLTSWFSPREIGRAWGVWNASHQIGEKRWQEKIV